MLAFSVNLFVPTGSACFCPGVARTLSEGRIFLEKTAWSCRGVTEINTWQPFRRFSWLPNGNSGGTETDWYGILQVDPVCDKRKIDTQFRKLAILLHPDKNVAEGAEEAFKILGEAREVLSDEMKRLLHDRKRALHREKWAFDDMSLARIEFSMHNFVVSKMLLERAKRLFPHLERLPEMLTVLEIHMAAQSKLRGTETDWYGILGVDPRAEDSTITSRYYELVNLLCPCLLDSTVPAVGEALILLRKAWDILSDEKKRADHDRERRGKAKVEIPKAAMDWIADEKEDEAQGHVDPGLRSAEFNVCRNVIERNGSNKGGAADQSSMTSLEPTESRRLTGVLTITMSLLLASDLLRTSQLFLLQNKSEQFVHSVLFFFKSKDLIHRLRRLAASRPRAG